MVQALSTEIDFETATPSPIDSVQRKIDISPASFFLDRVFKLKDEHTRSRVFLWEVLAKILGLYQSDYKNSPNAARVESKQFLEAKCEQEKIRVTSETSVLTMMAKLIVSDNRQLAAGYALVLTTADVMGQTENSFCAWLENEGGIEKVRKTYDAKGNPRPAKSPVSQSILAERGRRRIGTNILCTVDSQELEDALPPVEVDRERTAIVTCHPDGSVSIRAIVNDQGVLTRAYAAYANQPQSANASAESDENLSIN
ncbi:hypothetical protein [Burkholderia guangdongensis]|uniref:hypothetical protein n=1 Tax=Burkholderia guangdongensis TaxID=1792500 RepID=UPI0015C7E341|nr:hypothetical protein [Burkholderia guangdongensis]